MYHSAYDTIKWYQTYSDGDYSYGRTLSQLTGTLILRLADAPVLPFQFTDTADTLLRYVVELEKLAETKKDSKVDMKPVRDAVESLQAAAQAFEKAYAIGRQGEFAVARREERASATQQAAADVRAEAGQHRRPAAPRLVQAPDLRAGFLHRLRRQDDAADSRRP